MTKLGGDKLIILYYTIGIGAVTGWSAYFHAYTIPLIWNQVSF